MQGREDSGFLTHSTLVDRYDCSTYQPLLTNNTSIYQPLLIDTIAQHFKALLTNDISLYQPLLTNYLSTLADKYNCPICINPAYSVQIIFCCKIFIFINFCIEMKENSFW